MPTLSFGLPETPSFFPRLTAKAAIREVKSRTDRIGVCIEDP
jgi:hypothetical protein